MAVTKRTRYEVLRRDNYTCRYCHATDAPLTVDHVVPTALGGSDDPSNLVAACRDCNAGKASTRPDDELVADVREDALRYAELTRQAYAVLVEQLGARDDYLEAFTDAYTYGLPDEWPNTLGRWFNMGVPVELVVNAAQIACRNPKTFPGARRFNYMCGIVWNLVRLIDEQVAQRAALDGQWFTDEQLSDERIDAYMAGCRAAEARAASEHALDGLLVDFIDRHKVGPRPITLELFLEVA